MVLDIRMITRMFSAVLRGVGAQEVEVEVNARGAVKPIVIIVGKTSTMDGPLLIRRRLDQWTISSAEIRIYVAECNACVLL